jgi:translocation and assembly module TamB
MRLTADVDVHLQGSLANPVEVGNVHFLNGEAIFRGNRFTLSRGDLSLTNPIRTQATLDLEARTRVQQYDLTVDISGPLGQRLKLAYRSDPPLPTEDVLSLLALGYTHQQQQASRPGLVSSFAGGNPLQSVGESALLSQALSSQVTGRIQRLFGVSRIKIDPNVGLPGFTSGARVTVEQQVTRDLTLTYVTNTASSQYRIIQFEWAMGENVSLVGVRDQNGIFGVELRFRRRFK